MFRYQFRIELTRGFDDFEPVVEWIEVDAVSLDDAKFQAYNYAEGRLTDSLIYHVERLMKTTDPCADRTSRVKLFVWIGLPCWDGGEATFIACAPSLNDARVIVAQDERAGIETAEVVGIRHPDFAAFTHEPVAVSVIP